MATSKIPKEHTVDGYIGSGEYTGAEGFEDSATGIKLLVTPSINLLTLVDKDGVTHYYRLTPWT